MSIQTPRMRQVVDWRAAIWAGLIAGLLFFLLNMILVSIAGRGTPGMVMRYIASILLGSDVLPDSDTRDTFNLGVLLAALLVNTVLSVLFSMVIAYVVHRGGILTGIIGGAILGLALYAINFYTLTSFFNWMYAMTGWPVVIAHVLFGALAGGIYEGLEEEIFVPAEA